MQPSNRQPVI